MEQSLHNKYSNRAIINSISKSEGVQLPVSVSVLVTDIGIRSVTIFLYWWNTNLMLNEVYQDSR